MNKRNKLKVRSNGKSYELTQSPLFRIGYIRALTRILAIRDSDLFDLLANISVHYQIWHNNAGRLIQEPIKGSILYKVHNRLACFLARLSPPAYLYSGVKGRSALLNAQQHQYHLALFKTDLKGFFPSVNEKAIFKFFHHALQCSPSVADTLKQICCLNGCLPTGSQISMPLAFWVHHKMFDELNTLAAANRLTMTVYVDDIVFSGNNIPCNFRYRVENIIRRHGLMPNPDKTCQRHAKQVKTVTGHVIVNSQLTLPFELHKKFRQQPSEGLAQYLSREHPNYLNRI